MALSVFVGLGLIALVSAGESPFAFGTSGQEVKHAADWLLKQRLPDWSWGTLAMTPRTILALQVASKFSWCSTDNLEAQLSVKQMELEVVLQLWRHHETVMTPGRLALYSLALNAVCRDPRQFHGHDLIGSLLHHEPGMEFEFAVTSLAVCSAGTHVRKRQLRHLLDIAERLSQTPPTDVFPTDTLAVTLLALNCIVKDHRNRNLERYVKKPILALAKTQGVDGNFGNVYSTALATQALKAVDNATAHHVTWSRESAESFLIGHQAADGSFGDVFTTTEAILALSTQGIAGVRDVECNTSALKAGGTPTTDEVNTTAPAPLPVTEAGDVTLTYTLWVGTNITEKHSLTITAPRNATFYYVMQMAGERDPHFVFAATEWPNGHYVHTLAGYKEEPGLYYYWLLYVLPQLPDTAKPPGNQMVSPVGVDGLSVEDGGHYLFWYKKL